MPSPMVASPQSWNSCFGERPTHWKQPGADCHWIWATREARAPWGKLERRGSILWKHGVPTIGCLGFTSGRGWAKSYIYIYLPGPTINIHRPHHPSVTAPVVSPMEDSCGLLSKPGASWNRATLLRKGTWCGDADDICSLFVTFIIAHIWVLWYSIDPKASSTKFNLVFSNDQA